MAAAAPDKASLGPFRPTQIADAPREHPAVVFASAPMEATPDANAEMMAKARESALTGAWAFLLGGRPEGTPTRPYRRTLGLCGGRVAKHASGAGRPLLPRHDTAGHHKAK